MPILQETVTFVTFSGETSERVTDLIFLIANAFWEIN